MKSGLNSHSGSTMIALYFLIGWVLTSTAQAEEFKFESGVNKVKLVELYTSQGCSSCPPAENWLGQFKNDPRLWKEIIPIAFHVTYWDYLGWRDPFGVEQFNQRQVAYRQEGLIRSVYTPGLVVDGSEWRGWFRDKSLPLKGESAGNLKVHLNGHSLKASYSSPGNGKALQLNIALLGIDMNTHIKAGENSGVKLAQDFVVLYFKQLTTDDTQWQTELPTPKIIPGRLALAAWVTPIQSQAPEQATGGWINF